MSALEPAFALKLGNNNNQMDRYRMEAESDASGIILQNAAAQILTNRSNDKVDKIAHISPTASGRMSRNSVAASRLLRARKDRRQKPQAFQRPSVDADDESIASLDTLPTTSPRRIVDSSLRISITSPLTAPLSPDSVTSPQSGIASSASSRRTIRSRRERVAGGAAAKLVGSPVKDVFDDDKYDNLYDETLTEEQLSSLAATSKELDAVRQKTREEFTLGPQANSRYRGDVEIECDDTRNDVMSEASVPSILNRSEVFHENATAAILALLTPRNQAVGDDKFSIASGVSGDIQVSSSKVGIVLSSATLVSGSAFSPRLNKEIGNIVHGGAAFVDTSHDSMPKSPSRTPKPLLSNIAERQLENIQQKMRDPNKQLADLLIAIASPADDDGLPFDRGYMVRRKNACGALKVLTANPANRRNICWTMGVLPALTSVLADTGRAFVDVYTRREFVEARIRAVTALLHLCIPKENRLPIFHSAGLLQAVITVTEDDHGEARQGCCGILAYLAKTNENRLLMVQVPGLLGAAASVIKPVIYKSPEKPRKKKYHWEHSDESSVSSDDQERNESMTSEESDKFTPLANVASSPRHTDDGDTDSDLTPQRTNSPTSPRLSKAQMYDQNPNAFLRGSRQNIFAMLLHVIKEKDNTFAVARHNIVHTLVEIAELHESPCHTHAVKVLAHLTRHRDNSKWIVFRLRVLVPCFVLSTSSESDDSRKFACYAVQNLSQDKACRQEVATTKGLVMAMCQRARLATNSDEKLAAISALKNLTDEPGNLIPMTNTPECFATLMQIAHGGDEYVTEMMQYLACDALATLSHWLRKIATSGQAMDLTKASMTHMFLPTLKPVSWDQWQ